MRWVRLVSVLLIAAVGLGVLAISAGKGIRVPQDYKTIEEAINAAS